MEVRYSKTTNKILLEDDMLRKTWEKAKQDVDDKMKLQKLILERERYIHAFYGR